MITEAEIQLLLQLSRDTNERIIRLDTAMVDHIKDDTAKFLSLTELMVRGVERNDTRWKVFYWMFWPLIGTLTSLLGYKIVF